ncbi:MAG: hypothetical protein KDE31_21265 [Caldilineaceae bacterium]|nr:hypothetical protein [Caldilineaceae bacterium]
MSSTTISISNDTVLGRLRAFLLGLAAFMCLGTIGELLLEEHWEDAVQLLPFVLCGLSFLAIVTVLVRPTRGTLRIMRWIVGITFVGSLFGIFEHVEHNFGFALEIQPNAAIGDVFWKALGGANPLLAPGILAFTALLALAASYYHPALSRSAE